MKVKSLKPPTFSRSSRLRPTDPWKSEKRFDEIVEFLLAIQLICRSLLQVELILEQMRLCLAKKDFIRTQIISKKISIKFFEEKDSHDLKLKFYKCVFIGFFWLYEMS
jgi:hypothetical protein